MNIDLSALDVIEKERGIARDDMLRTIAAALLEAYREYRGPAEDGTKARVDINSETGAVAVVVSELDDEGRKMPVAVLVSGLKRWTSTRSRRGTTDLILRIVEAAADCER